MKHKFEICLEKQPDMLGYQACKVHVAIQGDGKEIAAMLALTLKQNPRIVMLLVEALSNIDNVQSISSISSS